MPAIQPARLRQQSALLAEHFDNPPAYIRSLHYLLGFYANRAQRSSQSGKPGPLIEAYRVHPPVLRLILQEILPSAQQDPEKGFALCDALWNEPYLEFRLLATMLLGQMPVEPAEAITQRIQSWITTDLEIHLVEAILAHGIERLRQESPQILVNLVQDWLDNPDRFYQQLGLQALLSLINDPGFENLPVFFRMIRPLIYNAPTLLRPDLLDVLVTLARRSPQETAYFLRQCLASSSAADTPWLIRQALRQFPPEIQEDLRRSMRKI